MDIRKKEVQRIINTRLDMQITNVPKKEKETDEEKQ